VVFVQFLARCNGEFIRAQGAALMAGMFRQLSFQYVPAIQGFEPRRVVKRVTGVGALLERRTVNSCNGGGPSRQLSAVARWEDLI
jgi:hypothetical protein